MRWGILLASLAIGLVGVTVAAAQQGPLIKVYQLGPESPCTSWLQMRTSAAADTSSLLNTIRSFYIQGFTSALAAAGIRPIRRTQFQTVTEVQFVVDALDTACAQQPGKPVAHVLLNLLGYR